MRKRSQYGLWKIVSPQGDTSSRKPLQVSMLAEMNHRMGSKGFTDPGIKGQVSRGRGQIRIVVNRLGLNPKPTLGLDADEDVTQLQSRNRDSLILCNTGTIFLPLPD